MNVDLVAFFLYLDQQEQQNPTLTHASSTNSNDSLKQDTLITGRVTNYVNGRSIEITRPRRQLPQTPYQSSPNRNQIYPQSVQNNDEIGENNDFPTNTNPVELSSTKRSYPLVQVVFIESKFIRSRSTLLE